MTPRAEAVLCIVVGALVASGCVLVSVWQAIGIVTQDRAPVWLLVPLVLSLIGVWTGTVFVKAGLEG